MYSLISNINIAGIAACVPKHIQHTQDLHYKTKRDCENFIHLTGIQQRRIANADQCASDFCCAAANKLLDDLQWDKSEIDILILVTQTPDYIMPSTAITLQERLGLANSCMAFDINLNCSGYVVGLQVIASLLSASKGKKALLLAGDTIVRPDIYDSAHNITPLFGSCGTASALEWCENAPKIHSECWSDGKGYQHISKEFGAWRNPHNSNTCKVDEAGHVLIDYKTSMNGHEVFNFATKMVPLSVRSLLNKCQMDINDIDFFVFHQANKLINESIRKALKIDADKHPYSISQYGNTSSASVPLTIVSELRDKMQQDTSYQFLLSGFGSGLSWGVTILSLKNVCIPEIIEI